MCRHTTIKRNKPEASGVQIGSPYKIYKLLYTEKLPLRLAAFLRYKVSLRPFLTSNLYHLTSVVPCPPDRVMFCPKRYTFLQPHKKTNRKMQSVSLYNIYIGFFADFFRRVYSLNLSKKLFFSSPTVVPSSTLFFGLFVSESSNSLSKCFCFAVRFFGTSTTIRTN